jgi:hypothetical protein
VHYFRRLEVPKNLAVTFLYIALLSEIGGPEKTGRYIFIYIDDIYIYIYIYINVTSKHARIRLQRCVEIATKSVHYFRRLEVSNELAVTFLYI